MQIKEQWVRYVLPFSYEITQKNSYKKICKIVGEKTFQNKRGDFIPLWRQISILEYGELDLYEHIKKMSQGDNPNQSMWVLSENVGRKGIWFGDGAEKSLLYVQKIGLQLFFSGVGFLWFDVEFTTDDNKKLCEINNDIKELNYQNEFYIKKDKETYESFDLNNYILSFLEDIPVKSYFIDRFRKIDGDTKLLPDKYLIFSWFLCDDIDEHKDSQRFISLFSKGYSYKYHMNESMETYQPFENFTWVASREGCGGITVQKYNNPENTSFFENNFKTRLEVYFNLYILVLHQYYSNLLFIEELSELPKEVNKCNIYKLREMEERFSVLQIQTNHLQISHISHQNYFFRYLQDVFELNDIVNELEHKIEALKSKVDIYTEGKKQKKMMYFTLLSAVFVLVETFVNITDVLPFFQNGVTEEFVMATGIMGGIIGVCLLIWCIYYTWTKK